MGRIQIVSELPSTHAAFDVSEPRAMRALYDAEARHFWYTTRNEVILDRLKALGLQRKARFIELGCGAGAVTVALVRAGFEVVGVDGHAALVQRAAQRAPEARFWVHDLARGVAQLPEDGFAGAGLFDVIEHLDEPATALRQACALVRPGGLVVGTVPALPALWSVVDENAGHRERYTRARLAEVAAGVRDAVLQELVPFNRVLVPVLWARRKTMSRDASVAAVSEANLRVPPWPVNRLLSTLVRWEHRLAARGLLRTVEGASLWFALRRRVVVPRGGVEPPT
ncbi:MAG: class I SAM-dependent methyltransferase [Polyangiaceae bacterium]|nr:class I SAM-dependent methyltransferase [Polyangiaceae bacterium]